MARPKMKFTPKEAMSLIREFDAGLHDYGFCNQHLIREEGSRYAITSSAPKDALRPLVLMVDAHDGRRSWEGPQVPFPEDGCIKLKDWITTWVSPEGWTRLLAARRQRASKENRRARLGTGEMAVDMSRMAAYDLAEMADNVGLDRKAFIGKLVHYLAWEKQGREFVRQFSSQLLDEQRLEGRKLLLAAFACRQGHFEYVAENLSTTGFEQYDAAMVAAVKVGKLKLATLAALAQKYAPDDALRFALTTHPLLHPQSPLVALSEGKSLDVLEPVEPAGPTT